MKYMSYQELPLQQITPLGWLRNGLETQARGLTGHLEVAGFPYDSKLWACAKLQQVHGEPWWPYEQTGYWMDGLTRCGYLLGHEELIKKAVKQFDYVLSHADHDGYLGPKSCKPPMHAGRWSHMIFFRALIAYFYATGDERVVPALTAHYLSDSSPHNTHRDVCNVEIMCWVFHQTGNQALLERAVKAWESYLASGRDEGLTEAALAADKPSDVHGVTYCETVKQGAILYTCTGKMKHLKPSLDAFAKLSRHHMLVDGVPSSTERLRGTGSLDAHETCDIADYTWSVGWMFMATGDVKFLDAIEWACLNAAPGAVTPDFKALQYFSCPNQMVAAHNTCHTEMARGSKCMSYRPKPGTECCTGQVNRIMPNYVARQWMRGSDGALLAALYGPGVCDTTMGKSAVPIKIIQETQYPFGDTIDFLIFPQRAVSGMFKFRIPGWCAEPALTLNGEALPSTESTNGMIDLRRKWRTGDRIRLHLPMTLRSVATEGGGCSLLYGPLLFALPIPTRWERDAQDQDSTEAFPAWNAYPDGPWNYALDVDPAHLEQSVEIHYGPTSSTPFGDGSPVLSLMVPARRVKGWGLRKCKQMINEKGFLTVKPNGDEVWETGYEIVRGDFLFSPGLPDPEKLATRLGKRTETIALVPYGATCLRVAIFPVVP